MKRTQLLAASITVALGLSVGATAQAGQIGLIVGGVTYWTDTWTSITNTGTDIDQSGDANATNLPPGENHSFHSQMTVGSFSLGGLPVNIPGLNNPNTTGGFEIEKEWVINDQVTLFTGGPPGTVIFQTQPGQTGTLNIYYDTITDGTQAIAGATAPNPPVGVQCYPGATCPAVAAGTGTDPDALILSATLVSSVSSFTAITNTQGTGSFDITWRINSWNPSYIDISRLGKLVFNDRLTGTLTNPIGGIAIPTQMWDGTPFPQGQATPSQSFCNPAPPAGDGRCFTGFKIDSSQTFEAVPEPSSLALIGAGLLSLASLFRRKKV